MSNASCSAVSTKLSYVFRVGFTPGCPVSSKTPAFLPSKESAPNPLPTSPPFDVIVTGLSSFVGPTPSLLGKAYFQLLHDSLAPRGYVSNQAESLWSRLQLTAHPFNDTHDIFLVVHCVYTAIPTYPFGQIGFLS